ncbi:hypothetical protein [Streptomyces cylindrosporus]|uniref:Uncharacterized protein n=1 Tax=Streptomyces cylindrosporus TaxID=2927583 RepID=A0ABS9Y4I9_9ACTN|nr:hypothetical protein [Streptomyces cylindrosporus]MCI3272134.1 hypothetical protein [Streptomyces cylindrosporus]
MSDALQKAEAAAKEAATDTAAVQVALAAVELAKLAGQQPAHTCQHHAPQPEFNAKKWWTIGALVTVGGCVACALALAFALAATAIAVGGTCATACLLVLRSIWRDVRGGHR